MTEFQSHRKRELTQEEQEAFAACCCETCGCTPEHGPLAWGGVLLTGKFNSSDFPTLRCDNCDNTGLVAEKVVWDYEDLCSVCEEPADILAEPWTADRTQICEDCHKEQA